MANIQESGLLKSIDRKIQKSITKKVPSAPKRGEYTTQPVVPPVSTSAYKGTGYLTDLANNVSDRQTIDLGNGKSTNYSQTLADSKNGTAWIPGVGAVRVTIVNGKVQETSLPIDTIITPDASDKSWKINGANANGYTSDLYTGNMSRDELTKTQGMTPGLQNVLANNPNLNMNIGGATYTGGTPNVVINGNGGGINSNPYDSFMKQLQDMYNKQNQDYQNLIQKQNQQQQATQNTNNYNKANQQSLTGTGGNIGVIGNESNNRQIGAQIKRNSNGQTGAISRYLTQDIWKNK